MSKQSLLLVDGDTRSLRVLEVSLRKAGFTVTPAHAVQDALDKLELHAPDLIISETTFPDGDGFELRRRVRASSDWADIPFVFLTASAAIENKIKGLELGVDDYLTKPIYIKEIVTRINILLQKKQRARFEERRDGRTRFAGRVADMPVVDVIQTIEVSRKSGVIQFSGENGRQGAIYFRDGKVIDAEADTLSAEDAVYRLLTWSDGEFEVVFRTVRRRDAITTSSQGMLMEGMRRLDEWSRLLEQLPPVSHRFEVDMQELAARLGEVPDENNAILRLIDGKRSLLEVIDACEVGDLECLQAISRLFFEGLLLDLDHDAPVKRDTGKPMPLVPLDDNGSPLASAADDELGESFGGPEPEPGEADADEVPDAGAALMGGYRHSSLILIDAAVAAAQAIEPSLFDGSDGLPGAVEMARRDEAARIARAERQSDPDDDLAFDLAPGDDAAPREIEADEPSGAAEFEQGQHTPGFAEFERGQRTPVISEYEQRLRTPALGEFEQGQRTPAHVQAREFESSGNTPRQNFAITGRQPRRDYSFEPEDPTPRPGAGTLADRATPAARRDDLRMIGSHGRDRAEASGELAPVVVPEPPAATAGATQRELVTILPRRSTRELPIVTADVLAAATAAGEPSAGAETPAEKPAAKAGESKAGESKPAARTSEPKLARVANGTSVHSPSPTEAMAAPAARSGEARQSTAPGVRAGGPSMTTLLFLGLAVVLAALAIYMRVTKSKPEARPVQMTVLHDDAAVVPEVSPDAAVAIVPAEPPDAAVAIVPAVTPDAAVAVVARPDAAVAVAPLPPGPDPIKQAKALMDQATAAYAKGAYDDAISFAEASLQVRRTARTFMLKASALEKLGRVDDALVAIDEAISLVETYAPAWEQRGKTLWAAKRFDEARPALERYLELDPNGTSAAQIKKLLAEPK